MRPSCLGGACFSLPIRAQLGLFFLLASALAATLTAQPTPMQSKLIIVDPGHFHATLLQKDMYPWVDPRVTVYEIGRASCRERV